MFPGASKQKYHLFLHAVHNIWFKSNCAYAPKVPKTIISLLIHNSISDNLSPIGPKNLSKIGRTEAFGKRWSFQIWTPALVPRKRGDSHPGIFLPAHREGFPGPLPIPPSS